jgi:hypothetical protein
MDIWNSALTGPDQASVFIHALGVSANPPVILHFTEYHATTAASTRVKVKVDVTREGVRLHLILKNLDNLGFLFETTAALGTGRSWEQSP